MIKHIYLSSCKVPLIPVRHQMKLEFSGQIFDRYSNIKFHEIRLLGTELLHADRHT